MSIKIAVLVSGHGRGSNMQSIIDACASDQIDGEVSVVIGVTEEAPAMERATSAGVETVVVDPRDFDGVDDYNDALLDVLQSREIDLVCLAGYMRMLGQTIIDAFRNRIMNVHPALVPCFAGKGMYGHHVHEAAIKRGVKVSGCTVHFVDEHYDEGPIILQSVVSVEDDDAPDDLAARILPEEHKTYVRAIALFAEGKLEVVDRRVRIK